MWAILLVALAAVLAPAIYAQEETAVYHEQSRVFISDEGDVDVTHMISADQAQTIHVKLLESGIDAIEASYEDGSAAEYELVDRFALLTPSQDTTIRYFLPGAVTEENGYMVWSVDYIGDVTIHFPEGVDIAYLNNNAFVLEGRPIACHGCVTDITYVINEPDTMRNISWEDQTFEVRFVTISEISDFEFDQSSMRFSFDVDADRFVTVSFPTELLGPPYTVLFEGEKIFSDKFYSSDATGQITFRSPGQGTIEVVGSDVVESIGAPEEPPPVDDDGGGCLIATAAYGSELAPQVQMLREIRDDVLLPTGSGTAFMTGFNQMYYSFSPAIADLERENDVIRGMVRAAITPGVYTLSIMTLAD